MLNSESISLIKSFESCKLTAYECPTSLALPKTKKFWTIGWGNTYYSNKAKVKMNDKITQQEADDLFATTLAEFEKSVSKLVTVKLTANQLGALTSFAYNVGVGNLKTSTLLKKVNAKDFQGAAAEFGNWSKANGKVLNGLVTRRKRESALFLK